MEQRLFIYSRTKYFDYRLIYTPNNQFIPDDIRWEFIDFIREVIDEDNVLNGDILAPRWSLFKIDNYLLWGVGCRNSFLNQNVLDYTGTPIRGFFGQIIKLSSEDAPMLSFSLDFYKDIYLQKIAPLFESKKESEINSIESNWFSNCELTQVVGNSTSLLLNDRDDFTRIFPIGTNIQELVNAALSYPKVNIVCALNNEGHILKLDLSHFNNATILGKSSQKDLLCKKDKFEEPTIGGNVPASKAKPKELVKRPNQKYGIIGTVKKIMNEVDEYVSSVINKTPIDNSVPNSSTVKRNQIPKRQEKERENTGAIFLHPTPITKANRSNINNLVDQYKDSESKDATEKPSLVNGDRNTDNINTITHIDNILNLDDNGSDSSITHSGNNSKVINNNEMETVAEIKTGENDKPISLFQTDVILNAYKSKEMKTDENIIQLKELLIKIKSERNCMKESVNELIDKLLSEL